MWLMMTCLITTGILGGGYFVSVSALTGIFLTGILFYQLYWKRKITMAWDLNLAAFAVLVFAYLIVSLWAVDSGMALTGFVKFLPLILFYVLVSGQQDEREKMISMLPLLGSLMTLFSFLMMQFPVFEEWVSVAGRLAGFFQYPNTYALFMLVCLIIVFWRINYRHPDWLDIVYALAAVFGIVMSGSRTVLVLTAAALIWLLIIRAPGRKAVLSVIAVGAAIVIALAIVAGSTGVLERFADISLNASTFLGRILYARDALPLILQHPFGLGYYGYYYIQQSIQTGVYSVVNVHNELLQMFLDVGVIPAVLMSAAVLRSVLTKRTDARNRLVLVMLILHSLFDYDFQFLVMGFVIILFLDIRGVKTYKVPALTGTVLGIAGAGSMAFAVFAGLSDLLYTSGSYAKAFAVYSGNTQAETVLLTQAETTEQMKEIADDLISRNEYISVAYSARARTAFSEGNVRGFIEDKLRAIELAPYQYDEYIDYLEILVYCENLYLENGNMEDAKICAEKAAEIPDMLDELREKTSFLAWRINDRPQVTLSRENLELIEEMEALADGETD